MYSIELHILQFRRSGTHRKIVQRIFRGRPALDSWFPQSGPWVGTESGRGPAKMGPGSLWDVGAESGRVRNTPHKWALSGPTLRASRQLCPKMPQITPRNFQDRSVVGSTASSVRSRSGSAVCQTVRVYEVCPQSVRSAQGRSVGPPDSAFIRSSVHTWSVRDRPTLQGNEGSKRPTPTGRPTL